MSLSLRRRPALLLALAALLITLTTAGVRVVGSHSHPAPEGAVLTGIGSSSFATGGHVVVDDGVTDGGVRGDGDGIDGSAGVDGSDPGQQRRTAFTVSVGAVRGLYPGKRQRLPVTFSNPLPYPIRIQSATTMATGPRGCPIDTSLLLRPRAFSHLLIRTNRSQHRTLRFGMLRSATNACQNGTFTVTVTATAMRA
jgi:hypothetical protein